MVTAVIIISIIVLLLAALLGYAATKPDDFSVRRSATINAPPERVFPLINDFHNWPAWSPWEKLDPGMKRSFGGPHDGLGAVYEWEGNKKVGQGRMEIAESAAPAKIIIKLDFIKPFESHNSTEFVLVPRSDGTEVTWTMYGKQPFMFKVMTIFFSIDKMVGKDFERGLAAMKEIAEKQVRG